VGRIIKIKNLERENTILRQRLTRQYRFQDIISKSAKMHAIFELVQEIASQRSTVLIRGESGTGKELIARAIHNSGDRADKPFIGVSCAALAETLLESELFGYEKGAFTGAAAQKKGSASWPKTAPSSWTRSATSRPSCRWTCCACCRSAVFTG
jgi:transcriptional regulator with PAS, ATPase and Fis domain